MANTLTKWACHRVVIASEAKQSQGLLRHYVPRNDPFLWPFTIFA
jgi:hypothetical protein